MLNSSIAQIAVFLVVLCIWLYIWLYIWDMIVICRRKSTDRNLDFAEAIWDTVVVLIKIAIIAIPTYIFIHQGA